MFHRMMVRALPFGFQFGVGNPEFRVFSRVQVKVCKFYFDLTRFANFTHSDIHHIGPNRHRHAA